MILLLASVLSFLMFMTISLILIRLGSGAGGIDYFTEYRSNEGISGFQTGDVVGILAFIAFVVVVFVSSILLSIKTYLIKREISFTVLSLGILLILLAAIVSNALLALR